MKFTPRYHQQLGIDHLGNNSYAALFAGMGLGKTAMVIERLARDLADGHTKGILVIAPLRVSLFTWADEVAKWDNFKFIKVVSLRTPEGMAEWNKGTPCIYTMNYESITIPRTSRIGELTDSGILKKILHGKKASDLPVDTVVWDELSKAKNPRSKRIQFFRRYRNKFVRHWGLTGTPIPNSYQDIFAQIRLLDGGQTFGTVMGNFKQQYLEPLDFHERQWGVRKDCIGAIEDKLATIALTLRSEDYLDIPPVRVIDVPVKLPPKAKAIYSKLEKEFIIKLDDATITAVNKGVLVGKLQQVLSGAVYATNEDDILTVGETSVVTHIHDAKVEALKKLFSEQGKKPMLVIIRFKHERDRILKAIPEAKAFHSDLLASWNAGKIPMMVAHPLSMSHGLNMQSGGSRICWVTPPYSSEEYDQTNARLARTGQDNETQIFRLLVEGTLDDVVVAVLESKLETQGGFMKHLANKIKTLQRAR
jgi:SNF2 family DNA or RNA helicase